MFESSDQRLARDQARQNRSTAGHWSYFAAHREALERLLRPEAPMAGERPSLCVLGAGNCNDLDLPYLLRVYGQVQLVDIDPTAPAEALRRQGVEGRPGIAVLAPVDLTGIADEQSKWIGVPPPPVTIDAMIDMTARQPLPELGRFDVVLSPCVLSQTIDPLLRLLGTGHEKRSAVAAALRRRHLRLMSSLLKPGGRGVLAVDLVSSSYRADLLNASPEDARDVMTACVDAGTYFTGLAPILIKQDLRSDRSIVRCEITRPWLWHLGPKKVFLVYGAVMGKGTRANSA